MIKDSTQKWEVGETVKVGFMTLRVTGLRSIVDGLPDIYSLENLKGDRQYEFTPHHGIVKVN
jgi:hypothetical protein